MDIARSPGYPGMGGSDDFSDYCTGQAGAPSVPRDQLCRSLQSSGPPKAASLQSSGPPKATRARGPGRSGAFRGVGAQLARAGTPLARGA